VVRDYDALARAGKYLCQYGRMVTDNAAADLHALKRSAALWDVPTPLPEQSSYDGAPGKYDVDFLQFLDSNCQALDCALWGDFNQFLAARTTQGVPNQEQCSSARLAMTRAKRRLRSCIIRRSRAIASRCPSALLKSTQPRELPKRSLGHSPRCWAKVKLRSQLRPCCGEDAEAGNYLDRVS
jgi:hypothetical protein